MIEKILDTLYSVWQREGNGDEADDAFCIAYIEAVRTIEKEGGLVIRLDGRHIVRAAK